MPIFGGKLESSCWCCLFFSALLQFRQLWERITRIAHGRRQEWWDCFGLEQCIGQHQAPCQDWAELPEAKLGVNCRSWQGIWGLARGAIIALLLDSRHRHNQISWKVITRLVLTAGTEGLIQAVKDKNHLRHPGKLDFIEQLLSPSSSCDCFTQICHRDAGPYPCSCQARVTEGQSHV